MVDIQIGLVVFICVFLYLKIRPLYSLTLLCHILSVLDLIRSIVPMSFVCTCMLPASKRDFSFSDVSELILFQ